MELVRRKQLSAVDPVTDETWVFTSGRGGCVSEVGMFPWGGRIAFGRSRLGLSLGAGLLWERYGRMLRSRRRVQRIWWLHASLLDSLLALQWQESSNAWFWDPSSWASMFNFGLKSDDLVWDLQGRGPRGLHFGHNYRFCQQTWRWRRWLAGEGMSTEQGPVSSHKPDQQDTGHPFAWVTARW